MSHPHGSSCCLWLPYLRCGCHHSCDWNGQVGPRRGTTTGRWDGTASVSVDTKLTNAEHSMRPITRNTVKRSCEQKKKCDLVNKKMWSFEQKNVIFWTKKCDLLNKTKWSFEQNKVIFWTKQSDLLNKTKWSFEQNKVIFWTKQSDLLNKTKWWKKKSDLLKKKWSFEK